MSGHDHLDNLIDAIASKSSTDIERMVLGAMLVAPGAIQITQAAGVAAEHFYHRRHMALFDALTEAHNTGVPTEPVAFGAWLTRQDRAATVGGLSYLHDCVAAVPMAASVGHYVQELMQLAEDRRVLMVTAQLQQRAHAGASADELATIAETGYRTAAAASPLDMTSLGTVAQLGLADIEMRSQRPRGLMTGFSDLDALSGGLRPGQVIVVAGRPGMGKTALGLDIARHAAIRHGLTTAYFSMEMTTQELFDRVLSAQSRIPYQLIRDGKLDDDDWVRAANAVATMSAAPLFFDDSTDQTVKRIENKLRKLSARYGLDLVVIDHLGLMSDASARRQDRQQEVARMARDVKVLAKTLQVPVLLLCQLNRGPAGRADKEPQLTDLRESGEIEQSADMVIMLHREDYYDAESPRSGEADLLVRKNRGGPQDSVTIAAQLHLCRFVDMARP